MSWNFIKITSEVNIITFGINSKPVLKFVVNSERNDKSTEMPSKKAEIKRNILLRLMTPMREIIAKNIAINPAKIKIGPM